jgi:hypothetical protein
MKEKILKYLHKAQEEINNVLNEALDNGTTITNINLDYISGQLDDIITELEDIDQIEVETDDLDPWADLEDEDQDEYF